MTKEVRKANIEREIKRLKEKMKAEEIRRSLISAPPVSNLDLVELKRIEKSIKLAGRALVRAEYWLEIES